MLSPDFSSKRWWLLILGFIFLIVAHWTALVFRIQPAVSLWFPPSGVAIALTFWLGPLGSVATAIASILMAPAWGNHGWTQWLGLTDAAEPLVAWLLYRRLWKGALVLSQLRDTVAFLLSAPLFACLTSAIVGSLSLVLVGEMSRDTLALSIPQWWLGNALGTIAIVPAALLILTPLLQRQGWLAESENLEPNLKQGGFRFRADAVAIVTLCICTAALSVFQSNQENFAFQQFSFLNFVPILWAAMRFGIVGGGLTASYCVVSTLAAYVFAYPDALSQPIFPVHPEVLYVHKLSLFVECGVGLLVGATMTERTMTQTALTLERVRTAEYQARAQAAEQLMQLNDSLTQANLRLEESNQEKDLLLQREQLARTQLLESEERFRTSLETMVDAVAILSTCRDRAGQIRDFCFEYVNATACESNHLPVEEHLGKKLCELFPAHQEIALFDEYCRLIETGEPLIKESLVYEDLFGQQRLTRAYDIRAAKLGDGFIVIWREVTDRRQAEEALRQSEARFTKLAENLPGVICQYRQFPDATDQITYVSPGLRDLYGLEPQAVLENAALMWQAVHSEDIDALRASLSALANTGEQWQREWRIATSSGQLKWVQGMARSERQPDGGVLWDGFLLDITDRKQIEAARAQLLTREQEVRQQAEAASRMKDEFLAIVSHELRSPLNAILGWARLLRTRKLDTAKIEQALEVIERNAKAQTQLIEDLLDISRIIRGQVRLYPQPIHLALVIAAALDTVRPTADAKRIDLTFTDETQLLVSGDPDRLQQVIWNLLSNAIKFTPEGGRVEVRLSAATEDGQIGSSQDAGLSPSIAPGYAKIQVADNGKGISSDFLPYVFERFRQADSTTTRAYGGLGLGLAIVRNLVELHGGTVEVESAGEGLGATFTVWLPLLKGDRPATATFEPAELVSEGLEVSAETVAANGSSSVFQRSGNPLGSSSGNLAQKNGRLQPSLPMSLPLDGLRILVVDDESDTRNLLTTALEQSGAVVRVVASVEEAMQHFQQARPNVLVSDISMPLQDGYTLIRQIRALLPEQGGNIPAIAVTAYARETDRAQAIAAGFQMHMAKPVDPPALVSAIATLAKLK